MNNFIDTFGVLPIVAWVVLVVIWVAWTSWRSAKENREIEEIMSHGPAIVSMLHNELRMAKEELDSLEPDEPGYFMAEGAVLALERAHNQAQAISEGA